MKKQIFNKLADDYANNAAIAKEIGERMIERLVYVKLKPKTIIDIGCADGFFSRLLSEKFPEADIISIDMISFKRPGHGIQPGDINNVLGKKALTNIPEGTVLLQTMIDGK